MKKNKTNYVLKMKLHFEKTLSESVLFLSFEHLATSHGLILNLSMNELLCVRLLLQVKTPESWSHPSTHTISTIVAYQTYLI